MCACVCACAHYSAATANEGYAAATTANEGYTAITRARGAHERVQRIHAHACLQRGGGSIDISFHIINSHAGGESAEKEWYRLETCGRGQWVPARRRARLRMGIWGGSTCRCCEPGSGAASCRSQGMACLRMSRSQQGGTMS